MYQEEASPVGSSEDAGALGSQSRPSSSTLGPHFREGLNPSPDGRGFGRPRSTRPPLFALVSPERGLRSWLLFLGALNPSPDGDGFRDEPSFHSASLARSGFTRARTTFFQFGAIGVFTPPPLAPSPQGEGEDLASLGPVCLAPVGPELGFITPPPTPSPQGEGALEPDKSDSLCSPRFHRTSQSRCRLVCPRPRSLRGRLFS